MNKPVYADTNVLKQVKFTSHTGYQYQGMPVKCSVYSGMFIYR